MRQNPVKLSRKIIGMLIVFFVIATTAIGLSLYISWQLEGVAAAINDAGSQRMRTYRIGHLMAQGVAGGKGDATRQALSGEMSRFDGMLSDLRHGDALRPLATPRNAEVLKQLDKVELRWQNEVRPLVVSYLDNALVGDTVVDGRFDALLESFVSDINDLVLAMERSYAFDTNLLRLLQCGLVGLAVIGTIILVRFFSFVVIKPVSVLHAGMQRMTGNDLTVRVPVESNDELGGLAHGFNQMAEHLQAAYATLEERIEAETRSLAKRNHELGVLYSVTSFLSEPAPVETLCEGFLDRLIEAFGAEGGAVRLYVPHSETLYLMCSRGLSPEFIARETELDCGECLCGQALQSGAPIAFSTARPPAGMKLGTCIREGFSTATAFSILYDKQRVGIFNIYFRQPKELSSQESHLLETLGHHLGVAIENQRLKSREKELAISEERNLLAQELHDSIAQGLAFLNIQVQLLQDSLRKGKADEAMQTAGQLQEGVQESYDDVRELLVHFRTRVHQSDLDSAINAALEKFEGQTGIATEFERSGAGAPMDQTEEIQVMHIVQESLSNIRKHARASHVRVAVERSASACSILIEDDGIGFDPQRDPNCLSDRHVGLKIMRERAHRIGGECRITSRPGAGSCVTLNLQMENREN